MTTKSPEKEIKTMMQKGQVESQRKAVVKKVKPQNKKLWQILRRTRDPQVLQIPISYAISGRIEVWSIWSCLSYKLTSFIQMPSEMLQKEAAVVGEEQIAIST